MQTEKQIYTRRENLKLLGLGALSLFAGPFFSSNQRMITRKIPSTGEQLPVVGLGTWRQFDVGLSDTERSQLTDVLNVMSEKGGKLIDSSPMYGRSEEVIGELTAGNSLKDKFFYATKVWTTGKEAGITEMSQSMTKMKREKLDLMQVHNLVDYKTHLKTLRAWKDEKKVRYMGITHYTSDAHEELERVMKEEKPDFIQFNYSIQVTNAEKRLLAAAQDTGTAVIINEPFNSGQLFGLVKGKQLPDWAAENDIHSWAQYFLKYILAHPAVNCVIPGTSNPKHALDNMGAGYGKLPDEKLKAMMRAYFNGI